MEKIKKWINNKIEKRHQKISKRNLEKQSNLIEKISREYPHLTQSWYGSKSSPKEVIENYYTLKSIISQRRSNWIMAFLTIVIIVLTYANLRIVLNSSQPSDPSISLYIPETFGQITEISSQMLVEKRFLPGESIDLCIKNEGKTETGRITIFLENNWTNRAIWGFDSIDSGKSGCANENIRQKDTSSDGDGNMSQVPVGNVNLNLEVVCNNCEPRIFERTLNVCIWSGTDTICRTNDYT